MFECVRRSKSGDLPPELGAALVRRPKMNPGIHAGVDHFANAFAEGCPMALETWIGRAGGYERHARVVVEEQPENRGHVTAPTPPPVLTITLAINAYSLENPALCISVGSQLSIR